jgi:hypothetical protein
VATWTVSVSILIVEVMHHLAYVLAVNRFTGTRLEDLQGEISALCKDQHGCRYLQKKLEEGVPEHRDMIFRETFRHFAELMTGSCLSLLDWGSPLIRDDDRSIR